MKLRSFNFVKKLKSNKLSEVWLVQSTTHKTFCALKVTKKVEAYHKSIVLSPINEQSILGSIHHELIANIIESFQDATNLYLVLEFMPYGSLRDYLNQCGNLTESQARTLLFYYRLRHDLSTHCSGLPSQIANCAFGHQARKFTH